jgi:DNA-directed RNA polymerase specialized sigma24 family protein
LTDDRTTAESNAPRDVFATTRWTVVLAAGRPGAPRADIALEELCRAYWYPLYVYVRRHTPSREDAEDLTQAFFARFLERNYLEGVRSEKGRFRAFLLASLKHFLANEWDRANRLKRGGGVPNLSLDWRDADTRYSIEPADTASPDKLYDRAWAVTLLERVLGRLRAESVLERREAVFDALKPFLTAGKGAISYGEAATKSGLTEAAARVAVHRLRRRYRDLLREEIAQTLSDPAQAEGELCALFEAFGG